jgi:DNA-binding winged helix-turn-helix (wHTH) protein
MSADLTRREFERVSPAGRYIHTHFGIGYRFAAEPASAATEPVSALEPVEDATPAAPLAAPPVESAVELV